MQAHLQPAQTDGGRRQLVERHPDEKLVLPPERMPEKQEITLDFPDGMLPETVVQPATAHTMSNDRRPGFTWAIRSIGD